MHNGRHDAACASLPALATSEILLTFLHHSTS